MKQMGGRTRAKVTERLASTPCADVLVDKAGCRMKVVIAGSRTCDSFKDVEKAVAKFHKQHRGVEISEVVCGMAAGADFLGRYWAQINHIPVKEFPADWKKHGRRAGYVRNREMAKYADALIAIWDGESRGTAHMIRICENYLMRVTVYRFAGSDESLR